jgi:hypothetical protein
MMDAFHVRGQMFQNQVHWQGSYGEPNPEVIGICLQCIAALLVGFAIGKVLCWLRDAGEPRGGSKGSEESRTWLSVPPPHVLLPPQLYGQREPEIDMDRFLAMIALRTPLPRVREPEVPAPLPPPTPRRRRPEVVVPPEAWRIALQPEPPLYPRPRPPYGGRGLEDLLWQVGERGGPGEPAGGGHREPGGQRRGGEPAEFLAGPDGWWAQRGERRAGDGLEDPFAQGHRGFRFERGRRRRL